MNSSAGTMLNRLFLARLAGSEVLAQIAIALAKYENLSVYAQPYTH
jgi:hypothetical protein